MVTLQAKVGPLLHPIGFDGHFDISQLLWLSFSALKSLTENDVLSL